MTYKEWWLHNLFSTFTYQEWWLCNL